jgi:hypothetical protein
MNKGVLFVLIVFLLGFVHGCGGGGNTSDTLSLNKSENSNGSDGSILLQADISYDSSVENEAVAIQGNSAGIDVIEIKLIAFYNQGAENTSHGDAQTKILQHVAMTNLIYRDSGVPIHVRVAAILPYEINNIMRSTDALAQFAMDQNVSALRTYYKADESVLFRAFANDGVCGLAYQNNGLDKSLAYAHVTIGCPTYVLAHELGHTMGLAHSKREIGHGRETYARGYSVEDDFATVMAYTYGQARKINKFSSPELECHYSPCGIAPGNLDEADAVRALKQSAPIVASFDRLL